MRKIILLTIIERILRLKKNHWLLRSELREKFVKESKLFQLVSIENYEDLVTNEFIREIFAKNSKYLAAFLELNIVLQLLQETDSLTQRMRSLAEKAVMMNNNTRNKLTVTETSNIQNDAAISESRKKDFSIETDSSKKNWHVVDNILCWNNKFYIFSELLRRTLLYQNHDDSYVWRVTISKHLPLAETYLSWEKSREMNINISR